MLNWFLFTNNAGRDYIKLISVNLFYDILRLVKLVNRFTSFASRAFNLF